MSISSKLGKIEALTTAIVTATVTKIGVYNESRAAVFLSNETASTFHYAFGNSTAVIGDFTVANMFPLRADSDLIFTDAVATGPLFVLQTSGGNLDIKTQLD